MTSFLPSWLENVGYPSTGIGDGDDLRLTVGLGTEGQWYGFVNPGWFYHNNLEQYNYNLLGYISHSFPVSVTGSLPTPATGSIVEPVSFRPAWGPVIVRANSLQNFAPVYTDFPLTHHSNSFYPASTLSWSQVGTTSIYSASLPSSCMLVNMRDLTNVPMGSVAGTGSIITPKYYFYDIDNSLVYVRSDDGHLNYYADIVYFYPKLRMRELVVVDDGIIKSSYHSIENLIVSRGSQSYSIGAVASAITNPVTGLYTGDWVVMDYYISDSYILKDHRTVEFYTSTPRQITVSYEKAITSYVPPAKLNNNTYLNINPIFYDSYRSGYLFHTTNTVTTTGLWTPKTFNVTVDKTTVCYDWAESVKIKAVLLDNQGLPIPYYPISCTLSPSATITICTPSTGLNYTDGRGEVHILVSPPSSGLFTFSAYAGSVSGTVSVNCVPQTTFINKSNYTNGQLQLVAEPDVNDLGTQKLEFCATYLDGLPKSSIDSKPVNISSKLSSSFLYNNNYYNGSIYIGYPDLPNLSISNVMAINYLYVLPNKSDVLVAWNGANSNLVELLLMR